MIAGRIVPASFYERDTELVAREMLGMLLRCETSQGVCSGIIVETEAYVGEHDAACHAAAGLTARTAPLYERAGIAYVYFIYGMYWCVNAVTRAAGSPSAVLVRALEPVQGIELMRQRRPGARRDRDLTNGPGKLCLALGIDGSMNRRSLQRGSLVLREYTAYADAAISTTPRIGIRKAADWPLRWLVSGNEFVSKG
ncbi:MAG: DNA-3-methyladenine glycosylase [Gemmatimonadota bacterium]|nr:DNA-3-methyladenine glycosylase [Gemmatimonadota bacterium]